MKKGQKTKLEQYLINKIKTDFDYWQGYVNEFTDREKEFAEKRTAIVEALKKDPNRQDSKDALTFIQYDYNNHLKDLNLLVTQLLSLYKVADAMDLTDNFTESLNQKMQRVLSEEPKPVFIFDNKTLVERVKGGREKHLEEIAKSPFHEEILNMVINTIEKGDQE
jgi:hypothetical protein